MGETAISGAIYARACNCIGPQRGEPLCPCMMRNVSVRDGHWIKPEADLGPVKPAPAPLATRGCICPPTSEKTCEAPLCPRKSLKAPA